MKVGRHCECRCPSAPLSINRHSADHQGCLVLWQLLNEFGIPLWIPLPQKPNVNATKAKLSDYIWWFKSLHTFVQFYRRQLELWRFSCFCGYILFLKLFTQINHKFTFKFKLWNTPFSQIIEVVKRQHIHQSSVKIWVVKIPDYIPNNTQHL